MTAYHLKSIGDDEPRPLMSLVRPYGYEGLERLIDPDTRTQMDNHSFHKFEEIAYHCVSFNLMERPTINRIIELIEIALYFQVSLYIQYFE